MPRDGSPGSRAGATPPPSPIFGEVSAPPFAIVPDPATLFERRAARFAALAPGHQIEPYLHFLAGLAGAQHRTQARLPTAILPSSERLALAKANGLPPLSAGQVELDGVADATFTTLLDEIAGVTLSPAAGQAAEHLRAASPEERRLAMQAVVLDEIPRDEIAAHVLAAAAVQVHLSRLAHRLDVASLERITDGTCPACGGAPVSSMVVGWQGAHGARFCTCSLCSTQWNVVRIKCLACNGEKAIAYHSIEGRDEPIMGETCGECRSYLKMLHQHKDAGLEPFADDVASLALDMTLAREGWTRASVNPFLIGY